MGIDESDGVEELQLFGSGSEKLFDELADYQIVLELTKLSNIRMGEDNKIHADITIEKVPEGALFVQQNSAFCWEENKDGFPVHVEVFPAFYNLHRAWILALLYEDDLWEDKPPEEWLDDERVLTYEEGLELYKAHS